MYNLTSIGGRIRLTGLFLLFVTAVSAHAVQLPASEGKRAMPNMVDARVNLQDSLVRALAARPGARESGQAAANAQAVGITAAIAQRLRATPTLEIKVSHSTGGVTSIHNSAGALTTAAPGVASEVIVRDYLQRSGDLFGLGGADVNDLVVLGDSRGGASGLRMLRVEQQIDGRPIFQSETRFLLDREGRLWKAVGMLVPRARARTPAIDSEKIMAPGVAVSRLMGTLGHAIAPSAIAIVADNGLGTLELAVTDPLINGRMTARQVLFPLAPGVLVPAWSLVVFTSGRQDWYAIVDAETGELLWRKNIRNYASTHDARFRVYVQADGVTPADSPSPLSPTTAAPGVQPPEIAPSVVSMQTAQDLLASPNGWIDDCPGGVCTANETQTLGNNVLVCLDRVSALPLPPTTTSATRPRTACSTATVGPRAIPTRTRGIATFSARPRATFRPTICRRRKRATPRRTDRDRHWCRPGFVPARRGDTTLLHHQLVPRQAVPARFRRGIRQFPADQLLGFRCRRRPRTGGRAGRLRHQQREFRDAAGRHVRAYADVPLHGADDRPRRIARRRDRDPRIDARHEQPPGRQRGGTQLGSGRRLGEGWSDFYALSLLNNTNADDPNAVYASGGYATYKLAGLLDNYIYGIRRFPYSTDNTVNPLTWADVDDVTNNLSGGIAPSSLNFNDAGGMEVHNAGELWALTLWEVRARVIADPAGANGDVPTGNQTMLQLVTDALKMTPIDPRFTDGRDAIVQADCATNACANEASIWSGFADRGLGYNAKTPYNIMFGYTASHMGIKESFQSPYLDVVNPATDVTVNDSTTNNNGQLDPGETVRLLVKLTNPWRAAGKAVANATATLTSTTPGVTIYTNTSTYGAMAPQGTATGTAFIVGVSASVPCGAAIDFMLTTVSSLGTTSTTFRIRTGGASGTDSVVTYTNVVPGGLAIPDDRPRAAFTQATIADDFEIADLDFRVDSLTHTFTGDLTVALRSPDAIGSDIISLIGGLTDGGPGNNLINMVIDDQVAAIVANDMVQATAAAAPFTKSWLPVFNAPWSALTGFGPPDPVGSLSRYNGTSTKGTWSVMVSDQFAPDSGTLNTWSMIVTPRRFVCTVVVPAVTVGATKTVTGAFSVGGTVTYTVTLTNTGSGNQADNPGNEFTDVLPAGSDAGQCDGDQRHGGGDDRDQHGDMERFTRAARRQHDDHNHRYRERRHARHHDQQPGIDRVRCRRERHQRGVGNDG